MAKEKNGSLLYAEWQYKMLMRCSEKKDMSEWNRWRSIMKEKIYLEEAELNDAYLKGAGLSNAHLKGAYLANACLEDASIKDADLTGAFMMEANLKRAKCYRARLQSTELHEANLKGAELREADCQGTWLNEAKLQGAKFHLARVDALTSITKCEFDKETDFTGVALDAASIDPGLKAAFRDNIRRIHWKKWFATGNWAFRVVKNIFVRPFWWMTGYGSSTSAVICWFLALAFSFGVTYFVLDYNGSNVIKDLSVEGMPKGHTFLRAMYFSVVTMTTLGFGDMAAFEESYWGHILLMVQVIMGYVLLGALVTRLGIVFTGEAPAAAPTPAKEKVLKEKVLEDWQKGLIFSVLVYALLAYLIFR